MDQPIPNWRQAGRGIQSWKGAIVAPERYHLPNCKQASLLTKTSWDSGQSTSAGKISQRSAPQERYTVHLRRRAGCTPRKPSSRDGGCNKLQPPSAGDCARQASGHLSCLDLGRAQNAGPTKSEPLWSTREPEPEWLRPGKCMQPRPTSNSSWQSHLEAEQCRLGKHTHREQ